MSSVEGLLLEASRAKTPREQIRLTRLAIARAKVKYPELVEDLQGLEARLDKFQRGINWEAFTAYAFAGRWDFIDSDEKYFTFAKALSELDKIVSEVLRLVDLARERRKKALLEKLEEVLAG